MINGKIAQEVTTNWVERVGQERFAGSRHILLLAEGDVFADGSKDSTRTCMAVGKARLNPECNERQHKIK